MITPLLDARRWTRMGSVDGRGGGPAGRLPQPVGLVHGQRVRAHSEQFAGAEVVEHERGGFEADPDPPAAEDLGGDLGDLVVKCSPQPIGHVIPAATPPPHDQRAHGLPQDLQRSDEDSIDPPATTGTEPAETARQKPLDGTFHGSCQENVDNPGSFIPSCR
jgi:hypothetical protein